MHEILNSITTNPHNLDTLRHVASSWSKLRDLAVEFNRPSIPLDSLEELRDKAQRKLTDLLIRKQDSMILQLARQSEAPERNLARILSCKGKDAGAFLNAIPKLPVFAIEPADFRIILRLRLGMKQSCIIPGTVCACSRHTPIDPHGHHYLECGEGGHLLSRHNHLQTI